MYMERTIVLDESGAMHLENERYFVIAGFITEDIQIAISVQRKLELDLHRNANRNPKTANEIKGSNITIGQRCNFMNSYIECDFIQPIAIVVDKNHIKKRLHENTGYNFYAGALLKSLIRNNYLTEELCVLNLLTDQRTISANHARDFGAQMEHYLLEAGFDCSTTYKQRVSKSHPEARVADIISNSVWAHFHVDKTKKRMEKDVGLEDNMWIVKFPHKSFGL